MSVAVYVMMLVGLLVGAAVGILVFGLGSPYPVLGCTFGGQFVAGVGAALLVVC